MSWHQLPIQHPLESIPMSHLRQQSDQARMQRQDTSWREFVTNHSSVSQLQLVLHIPADGILSAIAMTDRWRCHVQVQIELKFEELGSMSRLRTQLRLDLNILIFPLLFHTLQV